MDFQQLDEGKFLLNIPEADNINHIVIFLTGIIPLPAGLAGAVYFSWPDPNAPPNWQLLGMLNGTKNCYHPFENHNDYLKMLFLMSNLGYISNSKPSAIFKISTLKKLDEMETNGLSAAMSQFNVFGSQPISHTAQIGVSIEPESQVTQLVPATVSTIPPTMQSIKSGIPYRQNSKLFLLSHTFRRRPAVTSNLGRKFWKISSIL